MSIYVSRVHFRHVVPAFFEGFVEVIAEILSHFAPHLLHQASHALRIILVEVAELARVGESLEAGFFRFWSGEPGHDPLKSRAVAILARRWRLVAQAEDEHAVPISTVCAAIFIDRHGLPRKKGAYGLWLKADAQIEERMAYSRCASSRAAPARRTASAVGSFATDRDPSHPGRHPLKSRSTRSPVPRKRRTTHMLYAISSYLPLDRPASDAQHRPAAPLPDCG